MTQTLEFSPAPVAPPGRHARGPVTVLFAHSGHDWITGAERCLLDLVTRVDPARFRPVVVCDAPTLQKEVQRLGFEAELIGRWTDSEVPSARVRAQVRAILARHRVAVVHANMAGPLKALVPEVRRARLPLLLHLHVPISDRFDRLHGLMHQPTITVGVADHVLRPFREDGASADRLAVVYNAVDAARLDGGDARGLRVELGIPERAFVAVSLGSLIHRKGHDVSVRAVALARSRGVDAHLVVCGIGDGQATDSTRLLQRMARQYGISSAVHLLGTRQDVGAILRDVADLYVSNAREEALPLNVLEAQWVGAPVLASDIAAHREAVVAGVTGVLVPAEDSAAVADQLVALAADPARRRELAEAGRRFAQERFAMSRYVGEFEQLYERLLARPRRANGWVLGSAWPPAYTAWAARYVLRRVGLYTPPPPASPVIPPDAAPGSLLDDLYLDDEIPPAGGAHPHSAPGVA